jgi:hypothetical protein
MSALNGCVVSWPNVVARIPGCECAWHKTSQKWAQEGKAGADDANVDLYRAPGCGRRVVIGWIARVRDGHKRLKTYDGDDTNTVVHLLAYFKSSYEKIGLIAGHSLTTP